MKILLATLPILLTIGIIFFLILPTHAQTSYCPGGDLDCNGKLEINDLKVLLSLYGTNNSQADLNRSGKVDTVDAAILLAKIFSLTGPVPPQNPNYGLYNAAKEKVPDFCTTGLVPGGGSIVTTTKSGNWSDPTVWSNGQVPNNIANGAQILASHTITYDEAPGSDIKTSCIRIAQDGALKFRTDIDTKLTVGTLIDYGYLEVGTEINPVQTGKKAEIVIADQPLMIDTTTPANSKDPNQMGTGILVLKNGIIRVRGETKEADPNIYNPNTHAFIRLTADPKAGQTTLNLSEDVTQYNWRIGDKIVLPDSRQGPANQTMRLGQYIQHNEYPTITNISSDGKTVTFSPALVVDHPGAKDVDGTMRFLPHVGNLTRNVLVHSPSGAATRGHMLFSERADVDLRYAQFDDMGRTQAAVPLDSVTYDASNNVTHIGTNQIGRYTIHFHHDEGPVRTGVQQTDPRVFQAVAVGNAIDENGGSKWGLTIHDTSFGLFKNNTIAQSRGANIMVEAGNEFKNIIEGNFLVGSFGPQIQQGNNMSGDAENRCSIPDTGWEGTGIWSSSPFNYYRNNVAAGNKDSDYVMYFEYGDSLCPKRTNLMVPSTNYVINSNAFSDPNAGTGTGTDYRGADMYDMTQTTNVGSGSTQRLIQFYNNEAYGTSEHGLSLWAGGWGTTIDTIRAWHTGVGVQFTYTAEGETSILPHVVKNSTFRGDVALLNTPDIDNGVLWDEQSGTAGIWTEQQQYVNFENINNNDVQGYKFGLFGGCADYTADHNTLINYHNIRLYEAQCRFARKVNITNNTFNAVPSLVLTTHPPLDVYLAPKARDVIESTVASSIGPHWNITTHPDIIKMTSNTSKGQALVDSRLYFLEQDPNFNIKQADAVTSQNTTYWNQWPDMTNLLAWSTYGNAIADSIAPCNTKLPNIQGFVCPLSDPLTDDTIRPQVQINVNGNAGIPAGGNNNSSAFQIQASTINLGYTVNGVGLTKQFNLNLGANFLTVTDADVPANQQLSVLDLNKNGVVDPIEQFKKTLMIERVP